MQTIRMLAISKNFYDLNNMNMLISPALLKPWLSDKNKQEIVKFIY